MTVSLIVSLSEPLSPALTAVFAPDGRRVVTGAGVLRIFDLNAGRAFGEPRIEGWLDRAGFNADGSRIAAIGEDNSVQVWDVTTATPVLVPLRHGGKLSTMAISPDGRRILTGSVDQSVRVWDVATGKPLTGPLRHPSYPSRSAFSPDGSKIVIAAASTALLWDVDGGRLIAGNLAHADRIVNVGFGPNCCRSVERAIDPSFEGAGDGPTESRAGTIAALT